MAMKVKIFEFYLTPKTNNSPSFEELELNNFMKDKDVVDVQSFMFHETDLVLSRYVILYRDNKQ